MKRQRNIITASTACLSLVIGSAVGFSVTTATAENLESRDTSTQRVKKEDFPKNQAGESYGSIANVATAEDEPDLVWTYGDGGVMGYVKKLDLNSRYAQTLEEAQKMSKEKSQTKVLKLYGEDGKIVIGTKTLGD